LLDFSQKEETMPYAKWLRKMRRRSGYTQEKVAQSINVSREAVSRWEQGKTRPDYESLQKLFHLYDCTTEEILDFINPQVTIPFCHRDNKISE
jgi:transcriptional regulator with XRE-family HTH domain